jgi:hypothetical protein
MAMSAKIGTSKFFGVTMSNKMTCAFKVVIPARYDSSRLPGKPLLMIAGKPMVLHVFIVNQRTLTNWAGQNI